MYLHHSQTGVYNVGHDKCHHAERLLRRKCSGSIYVAIAVQAKVTPLPLPLLIRATMTMWWIASMQEPYPVDRHWCLLPHLPALVIGHPLGVGAGKRTAGC